MAYRSDVAFSPAVKEAQRLRGSREALASRDWSQALPDQLQAFVAERDSFYLATASLDGRPYVQHRGGPPGFLAVLDEVTLAFADQPGNRQYITVGNLSENPRVMLFLMDYPNRRRLKIWGTAEVIEDDAGRTIVVHVEAWDLNCPKYITPRSTTHVRMVALQLADEAGYAVYRERMAPILARHCGSIVLDVSGTAAIHGADFEPDRVLLLSFPTDDAAKRFYSDPEYVSVRRTWFEPSVARSWATAVR